MRIVICIIVSLFVWSSASATIYKFVDELGVIHYTDQKPQGRSYKIITCDYCRKTRKADYRKVKLNTVAFAREVNTAAQKFGIDPALVRAIIHVESWFDPQAISVAGAQGLMQLMPATAQQYGVKNPFDGAENIRAGSQHMSELLEKYQNNVSMAAAAYHAGVNAVKKYNGVPPYQSTQEYIKRIGILHKRYQNALRSS